MAKKVNGAGRSYANSLIDAGKVDKTSAWSFSAEDGDKLLGPDGNDWANYGKHHLGIDADATEKTKAYYKYPFAKDDKLYRSGLTAIRSRAGQQNDTEIFDAAGTLLDKIDGEDQQNRARIHRLFSGDRNRKPNYRMKAEGDAGEIYLYDIVGASFWGGGISARQFADDLKALGKVKTIDLRINSDGGDVFDGRAIYAHLAEHPARIIAHVDGIAASIASLIAMAANEIRMADGAFMMIHNAWGVAIGDGPEMRRMAELLDSVSGSIADTYAARSKQARADVVAWMTEETWMTGQQAVDRGFADVLDEPVKAAASVRDASMFRHLPAALHPRRAAAAALVAESAARIGRKVA